jgi:hypothetical protein
MFCNLWHKLFQQNTQVINSTEIAFGKEEMGCTVDSLALHSECSRLTKPFDAPKLRDFQYPTRMHIIAITLAAGMESCLIIKYHAPCSGFVIINFQLARSQQK